MKRTHARSRSDTGKANTAGFLKGDEEAKEEADTLTGASMVVTLMRVQKTVRYPGEEVLEKVVKDNGKKWMELIKISDVNRLA